MTQLGPAPSPQKEATPELSVLSSRSPMVTVAPGIDADEGSRTWTSRHCSCCGPILRAIAGSIDTGASRATNQTRWAGRPGLTFTPSCFSWALNEHGNTVSERKYDLRIALRDSRLSCSAGRRKPRPDRRVRGRHDRDRVSRKVLPFTRRRPPTTFDRVPRLGDHNLPFSTFDIRWTHES